MGKKKSHFKVSVATYRAIFKNVWAYLWLNPDCSACLAGFRITCSPKQTNWQHGAALGNCFDVTDRRHQWRLEFPDWKVGAAKNRREQKRKTGLEKKSAVSFCAVKSQEYPGRGALQAKHGQGVRAGNNCRGDIWKDRSIGDGHSDWTSIASSE